MFDLAYAIRKAHKNDVGYKLNGRYYLLI